MAEYRMYIIAADGQFIKAIDIFCPDDEKAKEYTKQLVDGHDIELWQGDRRIERFPYKGD